MLKILGKISDSSEDSDFKSGKYKDSNSKHDNNKEMVKVWDLEMITTKGKMIKKENIITNYYE